MTTYILAGGCDRTTDPTYGERLSKVVRKIIHKPVILSSFLSWPEPEQHQHWLDYVPWFKQHFGNDINVLEATQENFYDLAKQADVIYMHGGRTIELLRNLPDFQRTEQAFEGKIVIGSSAGANYLSSHYVSMSEGFTIFTGSGIIKSPVLVHYRAESFEGTVCAKGAWDSAEQELLAFNEGKILCLPEGHFSVIVQ